MSIKLYDRVKQRSTTAGSGNITFTSSITTFVDFSGVYSDGDKLFYTIENLSDFEVGIGTYSGNTLSRDTVLKSSQNDSLINLPGDANTFVYVTYSASGVVSTTGDRIAHNVDGIDFNLTESPSWKEGRIFYDNEAKALSVYNDEADITLQLGQEEYLRVRNNTDSVILNGQAVFITGAQGTWPEVALAISSTEERSHTIGLATHDIGINSFGYITTYGIVRQVDTSDFSNGDEVYLSQLVSGGLTGVPPIAPNYKVAVGHVLRSHPSNGQILVVVGEPKLGGGDVKSLGNFQESGVAFIDLIAGSDAAIISSNTGMRYDSNNQVLDIRAGGIKYPDGNTQTVAYTGQQANLLPYATINYVDTISGDLQTQISGNDTDISDLQTATGDLDSRVTQNIANIAVASGYLQGQIDTNDTDIAELQTATGILDARVTQNIANIATASGYLQGQIDTNDTDILNLQTATGNLDSRVTTNTNNINSVSGLIIHYSADSGIDLIGSTFVMGGTGSLNKLSIESVDANQVPISIVGDSLQSANLQEWKNGPSSVVAYIDKDGNALFSGLTTLGNLNVSGSLTYIHSTNVTIADKQLELASNSGSPISGDVYIDEGGIVLKSSDGDKEWIWKDSTNAWTTNQNIDVGSNSVIFDGISQTTAYTGQEQPVSGYLQSQIASVSGLLYDHWTVSDGVNSENIYAGETLSFTGLGGTIVSYDSGTNIISISGASDPVGTISGVAFFGYNGVLTGNNTFAYDGQNIFLNGYIEATGGRAVTSNEIHHIVELTQAEYDALVPDPATFYIISDAPSLSGYLQPQIDELNSGLATVSGSLYDHWTISDGAITENIYSGDIVVFTGLGGTTVSYDTGTNTVSISGASDPVGYISGIPFFGDDGVLSGNQTILYDGQNILLTGTMYAGGERVITSDEIFHIKQLTQAEYDGLTPDSATFYIITDAPSISGYLSSQDAAISGYFETRVDQADADILAVSGLLASVNPTGTPSGVSFFNDSGSLTGNSALTFDGQNLFVDGYIEASGERVITSTTAHHIVQLTQAEYDAITPDSATIYFITDTPSISGYLAAQDAAISGYFETRVDQADADILAVSGLLASVNPTGTPSGISFFDGSGNLSGNNTLLYNGQDIYLTGTIYSATERIITSDEIFHIKQLTQAEYDAITPDSATFYIITDAAEDAALSGYFQSGIDSLATDISFVSGLIPTGTPSGINFFDDLGNVTGNSSFTFDGQNVSLDGYITATGGRLVASDDIHYIVQLTQAEYDALTPDPATFYIITDAPSLSGYLQPQIDQNEQDIITLSGLLGSSSSTGIPSGIAFFDNSGVLSGNNTLTYDGSNITLVGNITASGKRVITSDEINHIKQLTQAEYDAITPDAATFYIITDSEIEGPIQYPIRTVYSGTSIQLTDYSVLAGSGLTLSLPTAVGNRGTLFNVKNISTGIVIVSGIGSQTIDGSTSYIMSTQYQTLTVQSDNSNWVII